MLLRIDFFKTYFEKLQFIDKTGFAAIRHPACGYQILPAALRFQEED
jgi:hypothetical protein